MYSKTKSENYLKNTSEDIFVQPFPESKMVISKFRLDVAKKHKSSISHFASSILSAFCKVRDIYQRNLKGGKSKIDKNAECRIAFSPQILNEIRNTVYYHCQCQADISKSDKKKKKSVDQEINIAINNKLSSFNRHFSLLKEGDQNPKVVGITEEDLINYQDYESFYCDLSLFDKLIPSKKIENEPIAKNIKSAVTLSESVSKIEVKQQQKKRLITLMKRQKMLILKVIKMLILKKRNHNFSQII